MDDDKQQNEPQNGLGNNTDTTDQTDLSSYAGQKEEFVTDTGESTVLEAPAEAPAPMVVTKKKSAAGKWLLWGLVVLLLAGLGALAYWQWTEADNAKKELSSVQNELKTVKASAANIAKDSDKSTDEPDVKSLDDTELVTAASETYLAAFKDNKLDVKDVTIEGDFARVMSVIPNADADGQTLILKKVESNWVVIHIGGVGDYTDEVKKGLTDQYGVPATLLE